MMDLVMYLQDRALKGINGFLLRCYYRVVYLAFHSFSAKSLQTNLTQQMSLHQTSDIAGDAGFRSNRPISDGRSGQISCYLHW